MKIDKVVDYNATMIEADDAISNYVASDFNALGKIALSCVRMQEIVKGDETVDIDNRDMLRQYMKIYESDPCLVLKANGKICQYTRNNLCRFIRGMSVHTHAYIPNKRKKNYEMKIKLLLDFMNDKKAIDVMFCVMSQWIKTPSVKFVGGGSDSSFGMKESYTNRSEKTTKIGVIESIAFNIHSEIAYIINNNKMGFDYHKIILPFDESYRNDFGDELFEKIKNSLQYLEKWNLATRSKS